MRFHNIAALLIDLDGTLLDTVADLAAAANGVRADAGLPPLPQARIATFVGKGADVLIHRALTDSADGQAPEALFAAGRRSFDAHYLRENGRSARPYDGVREGLDAFRARGLRLACVTNKPQRFADDLLARQQLADRFEIVIGGDALPLRKPDPLPLVHVAERFGLPVQRCLMLGDSGNDALAARAAGMPVLLVPYGYNEGHDVAAIDCDGIVESLLNVADLLD
ncbi:MAG: phosphoglycolate phosphatase [Burkholderiaceae bacterium]